MVFSPHSAVPSTEHVKVHLSASFEVLLILHLGNCYCLSEGTDLSFVAMFLVYGVDVYRVMPPCPHVYKPKLAKS